MKRARREATAGSRGRTQEYTIAQLAHTNAHVAKYKSAKADH